MQNTFISLASRSLRYGTDLQIMGRARIAWPCDSMIGKPFINFLIGSGLTIMMIEPIVNPPLSRALVNRLKREKLVEEFSSSQKLYPLGYLHFCHHILDERIGVDRNTSDHQIASDHFFQHTMVSYSFNEFGVTIRIN